MKIRDVSLTYGVSVRTLRYYEEMGLIKSTRESETTYRSYEHSQVHKLEQILMLRKLNVSIKDIRTIFESNKASVLLNILNRNITDIDNEVASLHKLKKLVHTFIQQIKLLSVSDNTDVRLLMEEISTFEKQISEDDICNDYEETQFGLKEANTMNGVPDVRLVSLPACKMVSSGFGSFDEDNFDRFDKWFSKFPTNPFEMPKDFLWYDPEKNASVWWYVFSDDIDPEGFSIIEFDGGLYAAAVSKDGDDEDGNRVFNGIKKWIEDSQTFKLDERPNHYTMSHIVTSPEIQEALGYAQLEILVPIKKQ